MSSIVSFKAPDITQKPLARLTIPAKRMEWADRKVSLPTLEGMSFERIQGIVALVAQGNYTLIHFFDSRQILVCRTLREMEEAINNSEQFVRVHRSSTINLNCLQRYVRGKGGYVVMENGQVINVATDRKQFFFDALKQYFG